MYGYFCMLLVTFQSAAQFDFNGYKTYALCQSIRMNVIHNLHGSVLRVRAMQAKGDFWFLIGKAAISVNGNHLEPYNLIS